MTDDNRTPVTPEAGTPQFGSDQDPTKGTPAFGNVDLDRILNQNRNAQDHIKTLESETAALRAEREALKAQLEQSRSIDELLTTLKQQESREPGTTSPPMDQEQLLKTLKTEVFNDLTMAQQKALEAENWNKVVSTLQERHGDKFASYVDQRSKELDIPVKKMEELAKTSPNAFLELVSPGRQKSAAPTMGSQSMAFNADANVGAMFDKIQHLRFKNTPEGREAKRTWDDPDFQKRYRMHVLEKAKTQGSSFGNPI
jgi:hypothetical protein